MVNCHWTTTQSSSFFKTTVFNTNMYFRDKRKNNPDAPAPENFKKWMSSLRMYIFLTCSNPRQIWNNNNPSKCWTLLLCSLLGHRFIYCNPNSIDTIQNATRKEYSERNLFPCPNFFNQCAKFSFFCKSIFKSHINVLKNDTFTSITFIFTTYYTSSTINND